MYSKKRQICKYGKYLIVTTPISNKILSRWLSSSSSSSSSVICQTTGQKPLPKRFLHTERSRASCFNWEYPLLSLRASSSFLRLLPRLLVTFICPFIFPSITCLRRQFLRKMWPIHLHTCILNLQLIFTSHFRSPYSWVFWVHLSYIAVHTSRHVPQLIIKHVRKVFAV